MLRKDQIPVTIHSNDGTGHLLFENESGGCMRLLFAGTSFVWWLTMVHTDTNVSIYSHPQSNVWTGGNTLNKVTLPHNCLWLCEYKGYKVKV